MGSLKSVFKSWNVLLLVVAVMLALVAISPNPWASGVNIVNVESNSSAELNGLTAGMIINGVDGAQIDDVGGFMAAMATVSDGDIVSFDTNSGTFKVIASEENGTVDIGLTVEARSTSRLKKGLDLAGGVRALLKPEDDVSEDTMQDIITITEKRLNTYGISDITVRQVSDLEGNDYILVEVPGANKAEVADLLEQQGKFEAKIANDSILRGDKDIKHVCRTPDCSGIDTRAGCGKNGDQWSCRFQFKIDISPEAAAKHACATGKLSVVTKDSGRYLSETLDLYLDDELVDSLFISEDLKGSDTTSFTIQGPGYGHTKQDAQIDATTNMRAMQTILISGSLPVGLEIAKMDVVSPALGDNFLNVALIALVAAVLAVGIVVFIRYRKIKIALPMVLTGLSEILIILGVAAAINWRLDLASIAGILAAVGTGVDDQIIITDEVLAGEHARSWKERLKRAFFIIFAAYFTTVVAMLPLWWMGAGLVKGFAVTTIIGVTIGVFLTRPAFAKVVEHLLKRGE